MDSLLARVYGKPTTRAELSSPDDGAVTIQNLAEAAMRVLPPGTRVKGCEPLTTFSPG